jgi:hypothetical protein
MAKITFNSYKKAIQDHYEIVKNKDITSVLLTPSPAQLRNYCTMLVDRGLSKKDEEIFKAFFETKSDEKLKKSIESCNTDKFKTIISFLKDKRDSEMSLRIEMASIIVDFSPRPYSDFLTSNTTDSDNKKNATVINEDNNSKTKVRFEVEDFKDENVTSDNLRPRNIKKKIIFGLIGLVGISSIAYTTKNLIIPDAQCMQWQNNHYEKVDCNTQNQQGIIKSNDIIPFDTKKAELIKINVSDTTTFFKNGKAILWYCKINGKPEFFNTHGIHPETGKALKPVTKYIINKYVK